MTRISMVLSTLLTLGASSVLHAQAPNLSDIRGLPGDSTIGPAIGTQSEPAIALGGSQFLAVWSDHRTDLHSVTIYQDETASDIYATRLDANGHPIEATPFAISTAAGDQLMPRIAWNGSQWLVVWTTQVQTPSYWVIGVRAARIAPDGSVLDAAPIAVFDTQLSSSLSSLAVASDGQNWLVVTQGTSAGDSNVVGVRVSPQGAVLDPAPVVLQTATSLLDTVDVAFAGGVYMLQWSDWVNTSWAVRARRFGTNLSPLGAVFQVANTSLNDVNPRITSNGSQFLSVWEMNSNTLYQVEIRAARVTTAGAVLDPNGLSVSGDIGPTTVHTPSATWDGAQWWVTWAHPSVLLSRISASGQVLDPGGFPVDGSTSNFKNEPEVAGVPGGGVQTVWMDLPATGPDTWDIFSVRASSDSQIGAIEPIALSRPAQLSSDVASDGRNYAIAFLSALSGSRRVLLERTSSIGSPLDAQPIEISNDPLDSAPAIAWNGSVYLVVWQRDHSILARRVNRNGTLIDPAPIPVMAGATPDVAALGSKFLVVGTDAPTNPQYRFVFAARVDGNGSVLGPRVGVSGSFALDPHVTTLGGRWLVGFEQHPSHDDPHAHVHAGFVDANGAPAAVFEIFGPPSMILSHVRVASSGSNALVQWLQGADQSVNVYAKRVLPDGTVLEINGLPISIATREQIQAAVAWDGIQYLSVYQDRRNNAFFVDNRSDIYGTRIGGDGVVTDPAGFAIDHDPTPEIHPAVWGANGRTLIAASVFQGGQFGAYRIGLRLTDADCLTPTSYCASLPNSSGFVAAIDSNGAPSLSIDDLTLLCSGLPSTSHGLFFFGTGAVDPGVPFGNGLRCVGGSLSRLPLISVDGGSAVQDVEFHSGAFAGVSPGDTRYFQFWFRDTAGGGTLFNTSNALRVTFCH